MEERERRKGYETEEKNGKKRAVQKRAANQVKKGEKRAVKREEDEQAKQGKRGEAKGWKKGTQGFLK